MNKPYHLNCFCKCLRRLYRNTFTNICNLQKFCFSGIILLFCRLFLCQFAISFCICFSCIHYDNYSIPKIYLLLLFLTIHNCFCNFSFRPLSIVTKAFVQCGPIIRCEMSGSAVSVSNGHNTCRFCLFRFF